MFSPLEQFEIIPLINLGTNNFNFSFTNSSFIMALAVLFIFSLFKVINNNFIPNRWQILIESIYSTILEMVRDNVGEKGQQYFPFIFILFVFVLICNLIGLIPYSFTSTSHLIVTFALSLMVFFGVNYICIRAHGIEMLGLFLPPGSSLALAPLLVPIEFVSYVFRVISLAVRLFANMMAGHTLLKVIVGFAWTMMAGGGILFIAHFIPLGILLLLIGLELGVAMIQAYVFTILTCIYLNEAIHLH